MTVGAISLGFIGDLMLGRGISSLQEMRSVEEFWGDTRPFLEDVDTVLANLECPITDCNEPWDKGRKAFRFKAAPRAVEILKAGNVGFVSLANNHSLDFGATGLRDTLDHLDRSGIAHAGAGMSLPEAMQPALISVKGHAIGVISLTDGMPEFAATPNDAGTSVISFRSDTTTLALIQQLIANAKSRGARTIVLSLHWGPNLRVWPPRRFQKFARAAIELGADIIHGHSAHLFQGVEAYAGGLILYDTGDFLDDYWIFPGIRTDRSFFFKVQLQNARPHRLDFYPVLIRNRSVGRAVDYERSAILSAMRRRCRALGTQLEDTAHGLAMPIIRPEELSCVSPSAPMPLARFPAH